MATPTRSPADPGPPPAPPSGLALDPAVADPKAPPLRDSRMDFLPDGSLEGRFDRGGDSFSAAGASGSASAGYSGIKVEELGDGPIAARGSMADGTPLGLLILIALGLGWLIWRFLFASGRTNFAGQDGNR